MAIGIPIVSSYSNVRMSVYGFCLFIDKLICMDLNYFDLILFGFKFIFFFIVNDY